jgi:AcrR family transcriptional regulator
VVVDRLTPERRKELTRGALIQAAAEVFARKGFGAASLDEIAEAAGFSRGAIHFHFESKEDLFLAVLDRHNAQLLAAYVDGGLASNPFRADPAASAAEWKAVHAAGGVDDVLLQLEFRTYALRNPSFRARAGESERRTIAATAEQLTERAEAHGLRWRIPVEQVAQLLHAASRGLVELDAVSGADGEPAFRTLLSALWDRAFEPQRDEG